MGKYNIYLNGKKITKASPCKLKEYKLLKLYYKNELIGYSTIFDIWGSNSNEMKCWGVNLNDLLFAIKTDVWLKSDNIMGMKIQIWNNYLSGQCVLCNKNGKLFLYGLGELWKDEK